MSRIAWAAVIDRAAEIVDSYNTSVTLRQLFYRLVSEQVIPNTTVAYKRLSALTAEARRDGSFPDLLDRGRRIHGYRYWISAEHAVTDALLTFRLDRTLGQDVSLFLGVEKAGMVDQLLSWFGDLGIPVLALGGYGVDLTREPMLAITEVAVVLGRKPRDVEREVRQAGIYIYRDWADRDAILVEDAREFASGRAKADREAKRRWKEHQAECDEWLAGRRKASLDAANAVRTAADRWAPTPEVEGKASAAANAAVRDYEWRVKRPLWNGQPTLPLSFIDERDVSANADADAALGGVR